MTEYRITPHEDDGRDGGAGETGDNGGTGGGTGVTGGSGGGSSPSSICSRGGSCQQLSAYVDKVDVLFMVDNSSSMEQEQASLRTQFPRFINTLTSGDRDGDGAQDFPPAKDLHLGVVSSDLGLPGLEDQGIEKCMGSGGDGMLNNVANAQLNASGVCSASTYTPRYLTYQASDDRAVLASDLSCLATLGIDGCGFEQQLESMLKAVWPGDDQSVGFVGSGALVTHGQNGAGFPNGDFIRKHTENASLVVLVLVTDEEDCSSRKLDHFVPGNSPNGLNTRCYYEAQRGDDSNLFSPERYIELFKMLRPGREDLVLFAAIVGVPQTLVTTSALAEIDLSSDSAVKAFYDDILADPAMQERIDDKQTPGVLDDDGIVPSCNRGDTAKAYPPRRILEVAKGFGRNSVVQSICQDDFGSPVDAIVDRIAEHLGQACLSEPLQREDGRIACDVYWEIAERDSLASCDQYDFLTDAGTNGDRPVCKVDQLAVEDGSVVGSADGFYYDDFSDEANAECAAASSRTRIAFTPSAQPPAGVTVYLDCD